MTNITVVGMGYVGLANAVLLSQHNQVRALEVIEEKVNLINDRVAPIQDDEVEKFFATKDLNLTATTDKKEAYGNDPEYVVIAAPTNYDEETNYFDTAILESVIEDALEYAPNNYYYKINSSSYYTQSIKENIMQQILSFHRNF